MGTVAMTSEKNREDRVRRALAKDGYRLCKTPARSWRRECHGVGYMIVDETNNVVSGSGAMPFSDTLEDVEAFAFQR